MDMIDDNIRKMFNICFAIRVIRELSIPRNVKDDVVDILNNIKDQAKENVMK